jgi:hypothetical protein
MDAPDPWAEVAALRGALARLQLTTQIADMDGQHLRLLLRDQETDAYDGMWVGTVTSLRRLVTTLDATRRRACQENLPCPTCSPRSRCSPL